MNRLFFFCCLLISIFCGLSNARTQSELKECVLNSVNWVRVYTTVQNCNRERSLQLAAVYQIDSCYEHFKTNRKTWCGMIIKCQKKV